MPGRADIGSLDVAIVDAEIEYERDFGDEQKTEEEGEPAQRFLAALLKRNIVDLINSSSERVERRRRDDAGDDRVEPELGIDDIGDVGAEDDKGRMGDIDDVEDTERKRYAGRHRRVEDADQDARHDGIDQ